MQADLIIHNGKCMTMDGPRLYDWVAVQGGRIAALGHGADYQALTGDGTIVLDAGEHTVLPGFIDSHFHVVQTALNAKSLSLSGVQNFEEIGTCIQSEALARPGESITCIHLRWEQLTERTFPDRLALDRYVSNVPVWINNLDYQVSMLNTYGLLYYKVPFTMDGVEKDANGVATGIFRGKANAMLRTNILECMSQETRRRAVSDLIPGLLKAGITTLNAMEGGYMYSDKDMDFIMEYGQGYPVDMVPFYQTMDVETVKRLGLSRIGGSLYLDGTVGARTAALSFEYADRPGWMGSLRFAQEDLNHFVTQCYENNLQLSLYTIGDRAIESALLAHEHALYRTGVRGLRHRLEHAQLASLDQIQRMKKLGMILSMNPAYEYHWGGPGKMYEQRLGARYQETDKFRTILDQGLDLVGGSDSDITDYNPLLGIYSAVNHPVVEHRISVSEALEMYTCRGAYAVFAEQEKGRLKEGLLADIIVLDRDILSTPAETLLDVKVAATIKSGELLYNTLG